MTTPKRLLTRCVLRPEEIPASQDDMEVVGVFNPGVAATPEGVVLLVRVAETPKSRPGWVGLPRWDVRHGRIECDWVQERDVDRDDSRSVRFRSDGRVRLTFASHLAVVRLRDGLTIDRVDPQRFLPADPLEEFGVEDPRVTRIGDTWYITYVAVSVHGPGTALASTRDFRTFERHGMILCPDNKDVVLFPEKIAGRYMALHRPSLSAAINRPEIWTAHSEDLRAWGAHRPLYGGKNSWEGARVGAGAPPLRTAEGWLELYHGKEAGPGRPGSYSGGLLLLDLEDPTRIRGTAPVPVLAPVEKFERLGFVPDVVFPTGLVPRDDTVLVYYGAADAVTGVTELRLRDLLACVTKAEAAPGTS